MKILFTLLSSLVIICCFSACETQQNNLSKGPIKEPKTFYGKTMKKTKDLKKTVEDKSGVSQETLDELDKY